MDILNLNECFNDLEFTESTHTYTRNGQTLPSVSKKIKTFYGEIAALELRMYHEEFSYAGTADIILRNTETGNYVIADYKTNKDLFKNYKGKTMKMPFEQMLDCPMSKYEIQLSYYQMMLEAQGVTVEDRWIIHVDLEDTYKIYKTPDHTSTLIEYHEHKELYDWLS